MAPYGSPWPNIFLKLSQLKNVRADFLAAATGTVASASFGVERESVFGGTIESSTPFIIVIPEELTGSTEERSFILRRAF